MSIYIKGMEMPNKKNGAVLIIYPDGKCVFEDGKTYQAVPVPPHGRLIDADKLADSFEPSDFWNSDAEDNCFAAVRIVHSAPTIIPASEEE